MPAPFSTGLLAMTGAQNPGLFSNAMSQLGVSPRGEPGMPGGFLGGLGGLPGIGPGAGLGQFLQGPGAGGGGLPPGQGVFGLGDPGPGPQGAPGQARTQNPLAGVKGPPPVKPQFRGGISGAQQAPRTDIAGLQQAPVLQLLQGLLGGPGGNAVPNLGALLGRR